MRLDNVTEDFYFNNPFNLIFSENCEENKREGNKISGQYTDTMVVGIHSFTEDFLYYVKGFFFTWGYQTNKILPFVYIVSYLLLCHMFCQLTV